MREQRTSLRLVRGIQQHGLQDLLRFLQAAEIRQFACELDPRTDAGGLRRHRGPEIRPGCQAVTAAPGFQADWPPPGPYPPTTIPNSP